MQSGTPSRGEKAERRSQNMDIISVGLWPCLPFMCIRFRLATRGNVCKCARSWTNNPTIAKYSIY